MKKYDSELMVQRHLDETRVTAEVQRLRRWRNACLVAAGALVLLLALVILNVL